MLILPVFYFPPIPWFVAALQAETIYLDIYQPYRKQRYFSRMDILGPNQIITLSLPVERRSRRAPLMEKRISFAENWQKQHWRSVFFSYKNSPYFSYYSDRFEEFYQNSQAPLVPFLVNGIELCFATLGYEPKLHLGKPKVEDGPEYRDFSQDFSPHDTSFPTWFSPISYEQVFEGFSPGLSILDLLFNLGPESKLFLQKSFVESHGPS